MPIDIPTGATGCVALADGQVLFGHGFGAEGEGVGELCFNTAMTGYQEVLTDPSYAGQVITFTFPHIGNVGCNDEDVEAGEPHALGCVTRELPTEPSSWRAQADLDQWMRARGRIGVAGVDTRALTQRIRRAGAPNVAIAHRRDGAFDVEALIERARAWPGLEGMDLARSVTTLQTYRWHDGGWAWGRGYATDAAGEDAPHVVAIDYGLKRNILRCLVDAGLRVT
ncbi:MAG: carbamoyl-phosphate synthase domain-containing protein, partial [Sphingomonadaceae bacterium]